MHRDNYWLIRPAKFARTRLIRKGNEEGNFSYTQVDWFGSWRDMDNLRLRKAQLAGGMRVSPMAEETKELKVPEGLQDWLDAEIRNFERRVHLDADGFLTYTAGWLAG